MFTEYDYVICIDYFQYPERFGRSYRHLYIRLPNTRITLHFNVNLRVKVPNNLTRGDKLRIKLNVYNVQKTVHLSVISIERYE